MLGLRKKKEAKLEEYEKTPEQLIEDSWSELKHVVDRNMEATKDRRDEMTCRLNEYRNRVWKEDELEASDSRISFNILFAVVSTVAALLTDSKPKARVVPLFPYFNGVIAEAYNRNLDYVWDHLELQDMIFKTVTWALTTSKGIAEIGYCKGEGTYGLYYEMIDPRDFFIAPGYEDIWDAPYCGVKESVPVSKVKALFPDMDIDADVFFSVDADNKAIDEEVKYTNATDSFINQKAGKITWYRVWMRTDELLETDEDDTEIKAFPNGITVYYTDNQYLGFKENEYLHNKPPFIDLGDYYNPGMFDSISEGDQIHGITKEMNLQIQAMMKRARRQTDPSKFIDVDQVKNIEDIKQDQQEGKTGQIYAYSGNSSTSGRTPVVDMLPNETDNTAWQIISSFKGTAEYILGYTEMLRGEATKTERQSAVEISILSEASSVRIRPKIRALERFIKRMTFLYVSLMQQYWISDDHWMYTKTEKGEEYYNFKGSKRDIQDMLISEETLRAALNALEGNQELQEVLDAEQLQEYNDYIRFDEWARGNGLDDDGPVAFPFKIEVESDSTLPLDRQSRAQLFMRLYSMKAVDRKALLDALEIPNADEILKRMNDLDKKTKQAQTQMKKP